MHTPSGIRELLSANGLEPSRALGQNFVVDPNTVRRVARLAGVGAGDRVVEIGAGLGSLTLALAETGAEVTAVEVDRHLARRCCGPMVEPAGATVVEGDALRLDWADLLGAVDPVVLGTRRQPAVQRGHAPGADLLDGVPADRPACW